MAKNRKNDIDSFSNMFAPESEEKFKQTQGKKTIETIPKSKGRPKKEGSKKEKVTLALLPELYEHIKKIAYVERISNSELVSILLEKHVGENQDKLKEYDKITKRK